MPYTTKFARGLDELDAALNLIEASGKNPVFVIFCGHVKVGSPLDPTQQGKVVPIFAVTMWEMPKNDLAHPGMLGIKTREN